MRRARVTVQLDVAIPDLMVGEDPHEYVRRTVIDRLNPATLWPRLWVQTPPSVRLEIITTERVT